MSDSDSSSESMGISDARLEKALRNAVEETFKSDPEQLTVKRLRIKVEQELDLDDGFFKNNATWNTRSKKVIQSEVLAQEVNQPSSSQLAPASSPAKEREQPTKGGRAVNNKKRSSASNEGPAKRRKKSLSEEDISADGEDAPPELGAKETGVPQPASSSSPSDVDGKDEKGLESKEGAEKTAVDGQGQASESEMSELIDEEPKPKKKAGKASSKKSSSKKKESSRPSKAPQQPADPDSEEIKRLQGWLVKCGIRKMWFRELAPYNTPKAKIRHLKEMLSEAGMTGRYSQEKATQIREERELKADIEAVQAGAKHWGKAESGEEEEGRPRRRVARGLQELDFLKDDDGAESD